MDRDHVGYRKQRTTILAGLQTNAPVDYTQRGNKSSEAGMSPFHTTYEMRFAFHLGNFGIRWYGLLVFVFCLSAWGFSRWLVQRVRFGPRQTAVTASEIDYMFILVPVAGVIGARLGQIVFYEPATIFNDPLHMLAFWDGGMASHGVAVGLLVAAFIWARRTGHTLLTAMDIMAAAAPVYPFLVRIGNFLNSELYGRPTSLPWGIVFFGAGPQPRHPTQLYESLLEGLGTMIVVAIIIRRFGFAKPGLVVGAFLTYYGPARAFCELFKVNEIGSVSFGPVPTATVLTIPMFVLGVLLVARTSFVRPDLGALD